jgi:N-methylhydantoinase A
MMPMEARGASLSVDIGGTFTDVVLKSAGALFADKTLTTHGNLLEGFFRAVDSVLGRARIKPQDVDGLLVHATTIVTNALIERKGARTAMILTGGFRDVLRMRDERRYDVYDPQIDYPEPLVRDEMTFSLQERTLADGRIELEVDEAEVATLARRLTDAGVASVGICFLNSYRNPANERRAAEILKREAPAMFISISSEIAPQIREYVRASTVAANAYTAPITQPYLDSLAERLKGGGYPSRALIMLSSGGTVGPQTAGRMPVRMVESGPAAGALGASLIAKALNLDELLAFDMGGTTAKVCLIQDQRPLVTGLFEIDRMYRFKEGSGLPIAVPCIDLIEIGAGGGSIAHLSDMGLLKVGPRSAGSMPGPAAYGRGGTKPTVTDANVLLGLIDANSFLGGAMPLDTEAAERAIASLGAELGLGVTETARGIYRIVTEAMAGAVRAHAAERGVDYRGIPLLAFGGAGPLHACEVAKLLKSRTVIFPPHASVLSAFGALLTPLRLDLVRSSVFRLDAADWEHVDELIAEMETDGHAVLTEAGCPAKDMYFTYELDMRYVGQQHELKIEIPGRIFASETVGEIRDLFEAEYDRVYRITQPEVGVEVVSIRVVARGPDRPLPQLDGLTTNAGQQATVRPIALWDGLDEVRVYKRHLLSPTATIIGPAVIEEPGTTFVVPPGWTARTAELGCIIAEADSAGTH